MSTDHERGWLRRFEVRVCVGVVFLPLWFRLKTTSGNICVVSHFEKCIRLFKIGSSYGKAQLVGICGPPHDIQEPEWSILPNLGFPSWSST